MRGFKVGRLPKSSWKRAWLVKVNVWTALNRAVSTSLDIKRGARLMLR